MPSGLSPPLSGFAPLSKAAPLDAAPSLAPLPLRPEPALAALAPLVPAAADCALAAATAAGLSAGKAAAMQAATQQQPDAAAAMQLPPTAEQQQQQQGFLPYKWRHHPLPRGAAAGVGHHPMQQPLPSLLQLGKRSASDSLALDPPRKRAHLP